MKCFYHPTVDAVALCKSCSRALCSGCIAEVGLSCSCRDRCEADVATLNDLLERGRTAYQKNSATYFRSGLFTLSAGLAFFVLGVIGVVSGMGSGRGYFLSIFLFIMSLLFAGWGFSQIGSAKKMNQK